MCKYKMFYLILVLVFLTTACSKEINNNTSTNMSISKENTNENTKQDYLPSKKENMQENKYKDIISEKESDISSSLTQEEYKELLITNYEKYIKPLDFNEYNDLNLVASTKGTTDNESFIDEYKTYINDNRTNLISFEQSMININIDDSKTNNINEQLIKACKIYIRDLDKIESYLDTIDEDILTKPNDEFINYLDEIIDNDELEQTKFENIIENTQKELDISLDDIKQ